MRALRFSAVALCALLCSLSAHAAGIAGKFDYWVLSLSWSPELCASDFGNEECRQQLGFVVRGLEPQNERGKSPTRCGDRQRVTDELKLRMLPLMATETAIQQEWNRYGSCSGLDQAQYFELIERARRKLEIPQAYDAPEQRIESSHDDVLRNFQALNPDFRDSFALDCRGHWLREVHACFDHDLNPRACGQEVENDCGSKIRVRPLRQ